MKKMVGWLVGLLLVLSVGLSAAQKEDWVVGTTRNVTWTSTGTISAIKIEYTFDGGTSWHLVAENIPDTGIYPWQIPNTPSTRCKVRLTITATADPQFIGLSDESDGEWTISATPSIRLIFPNGGEVLLAGALVPIAWESVNVIGPIKIEYSVDGGKRFKTIVAAALNTGVYIWKVPPQTGDRFYIRVSQSFPSPKVSKDIII